jgi:hypothetical protein
VAAPNPTAEIARILRGCPGCVTAKNDAVTLHEPGCSPPWVGAHTALKSRKGAATRPPLPGTHGRSGESREAHGGRKTTRKSINRRRTALLIEDAGL